MRTRGAAEEVRTEEIRDQDDHAERLIEVPFATLSPDSLRRLIEEFVTRDGTDYGVVERTLGEKAAGVRQRLESGEAVIVVDTETEYVDIVLRRPA